MEKEKFKENKVYRFFKSVEELKQRLLENMEPSEVLGQLFIILAMIISTGYYILFLIIIDKFQEEYKKRGVSYPFIKKEKKDE